MSLEEGEAGGGGGFEHPVPHGADTVPKCGPAALDPRLNTGSQRQAAWRRRWSAEGATARCAPAPLSYYSRRRGSAPEGRDRGSAPTSLVGAHKAGPCLLKADQAVRTRRGEPRGAERQGRRHRCRPPRLGEERRTRPVCSAPCVPGLRQEEPAGTKAMPGAGIPMPRGPPKPELSDEPGSPRTWPFRGEPPLAGAARGHAWKWMRCVRGGLSVRLPCPTAASVRSGRVTYLLGFRSWDRRPGMTRAGHPGAWGSVRDSGFSVRAVGHRHICGARFAGQVESLQPKCGKSAAAACADPSLSAGDGEAERREENQGAYSCSPHGLWIKDDFGQSFPWKQEHM